MAEYRFTIDYSSLHVIADGLSRLLRQLDDGDDPARTYAGIMPADHELRTLKSYRDVFDRAEEAVNGMLAVSEDSSTVTVVVQDAER